MSAPFVVPRRRCAALLLAVLAAGVIGAGCTAPGRGRLAPPPAGLPDAMRLVPADAPAFVLIDTRAAPADRRRLRAVRTMVGQAVPGGMGQADAVVDAVGDLDPSAWIGPSAGFALLAFGPEEGARGYGFADVADRGALERRLRAGGWRRAGQLDGRGAGDLQTWTDRGLTLAVGDDTVLVADDGQALREIVDRAADGRVADDLALRRNAVEALRAGPIAVVFREDALANALRRTVAQDPAVLELTRWIDDTSLVTSVLDGWIGLEAAGTTAGSRARVVGRLRWIRDAVRVRLPGAVDRSALDRLPADTTAAVAFDDLGLVLEDLVASATAGGGEFATPEASGAQAAGVELLPLLERLSGDTAAAFGETGASVHVRTHDPRAVAASLRVAIREAGLDDVEVRSEAVGVVLTRTRTDAVTRAIPSGTFGDRTDVRAAVRAAGAPPAAPIAWFASVARRDAPPGTACAGWLAPTGSDRLAFSVGIAVADRDTSAAPDAARGGACGLPIATPSTAG